jgi:glucose-1-phosphate thymidylyltransferase
MKGVLLHGGLGTRLRPLTHTGPKQLIRVAGKPVSQWALEDLRDAGVRDVAVVLGNLAPERVVEYYGDGSWLGLRLTYVYQGYPYGIAHAVYAVKDFVGDEPFVVYLGDNVILEGVSRFAREFENSGADAMVLLVEVEDPRRFGVARFDEDGRLVGFVEKPKEPPSKYALAGVYFFRPPHVFKVIEKLKPSWRGELEITDALQGLMDAGFRVEYGIISGWWKDTGTPSDILEANRLLLDYRYREASVKGEVADSRVEGRVVIEDGAVVRGSVIRGPCFVGEASVVEGSYVGPYTSVGRGCRLVGVEVENSVLMDGVVLERVGGRVVDSIVGAEAVVRGIASVPRGVRLIVGEKSVVEL